VAHIHTRLQQFLLSSLSRFYRETQTDRRCDKQYLLCAAKRAHR